MITSQSPIGKSTNSIALVFDFNWDWNFAQPYQRSIITAGNFHFRDHPSDEEYVGYYHTYIYIDQLYSRLGTEYRSRLNINSESQMQVVDSSDYFTASDGLTTYGLTNNACVYHTDMYGGEDEPVYRYGDCLKFEATIYWSYSISYYGGGTADPQYYFWYTEGTKLTCTVMYDVAGAWW